MTLALIIVGLLTPAIVSLIKKEQWGFKTKFIISLLVSIAATAVTMFIGGEFTTWVEFVSKLGIVFTTAQSFYALHFGSTNINETLTAIGSDVIAKVETYTPDEVDVLINNAVEVAEITVKQKINDEIAAAAAQVAADNAAKKTKAAKK